MRITGFSGVTCSVGEMLDTCELVLQVSVGEIVGMCASAVLRDLSGVIVEASVNKVLVDAAAVTCGISGVAVCCICDVVGRPKKTI